MSNDATDGRAGQNVMHIHKRLRDAILYGDLEPGVVKSQLALAEELGVGRAPVREALRLLQSEGLVASEPNRRVRISNLSGPDAEELYILRIPMEVTAIRLTVPSLTSSDIAELEGYMAQMDHYARGRDWAGLRTPHSAFHRILVYAAGPRIVQMISTLADHAERYRVSHAAMPGPSIEYWTVRQAEHRAIVDAAGSGDSDHAAELLALHYSRTASEVLSRIDPDHQPDRLRAMLRQVMPAAEAALSERATHDGYLETTSRLG
jgi:DNA-binding GntR family transcriptional regulator